MSKILGVTGDSGAGKGEFCRQLRKLGCYVIDCDKIAHGITRRGSACLAELTEEFGPDILTKDGRLNRKRLAKSAFAQPEKVNRLNQITHPKINAEIERRLNKGKASGRIICIDAPLLATGGLDRICDLVVTLKADTETRIARIMQRDRITREQAAARFKARKEPPVSGKNIIYYNDKSLCELEKFARQVYNILTEDES